MNRTITDHKVNGLNESIEIMRMDSPGPGGANHHYLLILDPRPDAPREETRTDISIHHLRFQNGPITKPADINGISNEALLAVLIDRMRGFQYQRDENGNFDEEKLGKFACNENMVALIHLESALATLIERTKKRMKRGVEGSMTP